MIHVLILEDDHVSREALSRILAEYQTGISVHAASTYEEAKKLLAQSNLPINTVSIYVGYSNFSYFTKMFKENTGYSPLDYRRKFRG